MTITSKLTIEDAEYDIIDLPELAGDDLPRLPYIHRVLLENVSRTAGRDAPRAAAAILAWLATGASQLEIPFLPSRVLMHDTTCGPALVDIAGMRSALADAGGDPALLNPVVRVDVSTDHSVAVDFFGGSGALKRNMAREFERNAERYRFMKWATNTLTDFHVHPPGTGIMHTLNLERLATIASVIPAAGRNWLAPDTLIGTDSHTPMVNGIGVLAWGVGGLEAESVFFGMPVALRVPDVIGVRLTGFLRDGVLATDLALVVTHMLRKIDLQDKYVEFFGPGVSTLTAGDRCVVANMAPEFGGNSGYFPIDKNTLAYLRATGRAEPHIDLVERYSRRVGLWFDPDANPTYTRVVDIDLASVEPSLSGPTRPQDRIAVSDTASAIAAMKKPSARIGGAGEPNDGAVAIAAITSCTNTSDPRLVIAAGLLAQKARAFGLRPPHWVKTSLAPGSPVAERYLRRSGLLEDLEALGFGIVGFGCTTCIGNSGALTPQVSAAMAERHILPVAVLSGNRNFPGRVHPVVEAGFLASPPMVIAFALAGTVELDILSDVIGLSDTGMEVRLPMIWPSSSEIDEALAGASRPSDFAPAYDEAEASRAWRELEAPVTTVFPWDDGSTYIRRPPFAGWGKESLLGTYSARPLLVVGNDITTDHISPAGAISAQSDTGQYLVERGESPADLNVHASRRGNWESMVRGLFTNRAVRNMLGDNLPPGSTLHWPSGDVIPLWAAANRYAAERQPVVIVAGERYGMGSSRDWAAKGVSLLGARAVLALSFERIHRSNLVGMRILPIRLPAGYGPEALELTPGDMIDIVADPGLIEPRCPITVTIRRSGGDTTSFTAIAAIETGAEVDILRAGGILTLILRDGLARSAPRAAVGAHQVFLEGEVGKIGEGRIS